MAIVRKRDRAKQNIMVRWPLSRTAQSPIFVQDEGRVVIWLFRARVMEALRQSAIQLTASIALLGGETGVKYA